MLKKTDLFLSGLYYHFYWMPIYVQRLHRMMKNISSIFTSSTMSACVCALQSVQLNGKEKLKVKDGLPAGLAIHHLHLMLRHMCKELL